MTIRTLLLCLPGVLYCLGCGNRGELLGTRSLGDASATDSGATSDAGAGITVGDPPRFTAPQLVSSLVSPFSLEADPTFTADLLDLFFMSDRAGTLDIWTSHRASSLDPWGPPLPVMDLNTPASEYGPCISLDGLRIWFSSDRDMSLGRIWYATRTTRTGRWSPPFVLPELTSAPGGFTRDFSPSVDASETMVMFGSSTPAGGTYDIFVAERSRAAGPWGMPQPAPGLNGPFDDRDPFVAQAGLMVFFASARQGAGDLFWASRQDLGTKFSNPIPLIDVNSGAYDSDPTLSPDLGYLMFDSTRSGKSEIYEAFAIR